ncbi:MAG: hypothetical protein AAGA30_21680, partial [Planctomycetota bacterium]
MPEKKRRRTKTSTRRNLTKHFFGGSRDSFGTRKRKSNRGRNIGILVAFLVMTCGIVYLLAVLRPEPENRISVDTLVEDDDFDPVDDFRVVRDNGSTEQLVKLVDMLKIRRINRGDVIVLLDNFKKIVEVCDLILLRNDCSEDQRIFSLENKLEYLGQIYSTNINNEFDDPFISEQFYDVIERTLQSEEDEELVRKARVLKANGLVLASIRNVLAGSLESA